MPNAVVLTDFGAPEVLRWQQVAWPEPGPGQVRLKVAAAGVGPTDLAIRSGRLRAFGAAPGGVLGFEAAGTVDMVGPGVTGVSVGDEIAAQLLSLGGYAEFAIAGIWTVKPASVSWHDAAALPASAEAAARVLDDVRLESGQTLLLFGGGGSVGMIATQLAIARGARVLSVVRGHDEQLAGELGAEPVKLGDAVRADAAIDAAGTGVLGQALASVGDAGRVVTLSDPRAADFGVRLSGPRPETAAAALFDAMQMFAAGKLRLRAQRVLPLPEAAEAHRRLEAGSREKLILVT
ncbi:NADP-dependent oxidoreductase [Actinoplanes sp. M2I2]|uniref:NADP-dependent oxidoreductase n=1 Tax=Actinoplanes sp. M2I2 TaxID=1734444 RepID=UPI0024C21E72|nr:NADP-dependent oxidoreductase [Actinoplanes sp. M2I2]